MSAKPPPAAADLPTSPGAPDDDFAAALGVDPAAFAAVEPEPSGDEARIAEAVLNHFAAARPDPASFPTIAMQILELVRYPDVDLNELAKYIRVDGALAGGVLSLANSAYYRAVRKLDTVKDAVQRLGISEVARLTAAISMKALYSADAATAHARFEPVWTGLFLHAATVGRCVSDLARQQVAPVAGAEQAFVAGLLHDVGKGVAMRSLAELVRYGKLAPPEPALIARVLHRVHVEIGAEMHRAWSLPDTLLRAAALHHEQALEPGAPNALVHLVRLVSARDLLRREPATHPRAAAEVLLGARALALSPARVHGLAADLDGAEAWVRTVFPAQPVPA
jgi:putative nucleotidyltransferase with HDIG domain